MKSCRGIVALLVLAIPLALLGCAESHREFEETALDVPQIAVSSDSIDESGSLLTETAADKTPNSPLGNSESPQLMWDAVDGAAYYAVCMFDEDANWLHWLVLDLEETGVEQGAFTSPGEYVGPYPPANSGQHRYRIEVFALKQATDNVFLKVDAQQSYVEIVRYLNRSGDGEDNILARGHIIGTFEN